MPQLKRWIAWALSFLPSKLPIGMSEFDSFSDSILRIYNLPNRDDYKNAIATMIMHLGPITNLKSKRYFGKAILKSMANQIAYGKIMEYKANAEEAEKLKVGGGKSDGAQKEVVQQT